MKMKHLMIVGLAVMLTFTACKKDDDDDKGGTPTVPTYSSADLINKDWRMTAATETISSGSYSQTEDSYAEYEDCEKDNLIRFNQDKTITAKSGALKCDPDEPDSETDGNWELLNGTQLTLSGRSNETGGTSTSVTFDILALNATTLKIAAKYSDSGVTYTQTLTFTKQ